MNAPRPKIAYDATDLGSFRFHFVVMADTHVNEDEDASTSPYASTVLTNARARHAVHDIAARDPAFVVHLGDLTHPVPDLPSYDAAVEQFRQIIAPLAGRIHFVPGNHDIGDKPVTWAPAKIVRDTYLAQYRRNFGAHYYAFDYPHAGDDALLHCVVVNASLINSGLNSEGAQREWLEADLAAHAGRRIFLFIHYPPFLTQPDERSHYDNVDEPGRSWLIGLIEQHGVEALFASHVHNYFYNRLSHTDCYVAPAISFVRHDYSEFFRVEPGPEHGRNDAAKLGYLVVKVYEGGHVVQVVRTHGATLAREAGYAPRPVTVAHPHPRETAVAGLGVHLRHPWAEITAVPATGGADEFERKQVRSDYAPLVLSEMGLRPLRVPLQDLMDAQSRARMRALQAQGHEFTVYSYGAPDGAWRGLLVEHADAVSAWEVVVASENLQACIDGMRQVKTATDLPILLSRLRSKEDMAQTGRHYYHHISHGFFLRERPLIENLLRRSELAPLVDGLVFRLEIDESPWSVVPQLSQVAAAHGLRAAVELRLVSDNPAAAYTDDLANANRIVEAMAATLATRSLLSHTTVFVDTLVDVDRSYFVRNGLVSRRYDLRLAGRAVRNLAGVFHEVLVQVAEGKEKPIAQHSALVLNQGRAFVLRNEQRLWTLITRRGDGCAGQLAIRPFDAGSSGIGRKIDLDTGEITPIAWEQRAALHLEPAVRSLAPVLVEISGGKQTA